MAFGIGVTAAVIAMAGAAVSWGRVPDEGDEEPVDVHAAARVDSSADDGA